MAPRAIWRRVDDRPALAMAQSEGHRRASRGSVTGGLHHRLHRSRRPVERAVDLIKGEALGFGTEYPEADQADHTPRSKIKKSRAQHGEVWRGRLDDIACPHDQRQAERADELAQVA